MVFSWGRLAALLPILPDRRLPKIQRYCRNMVPWRGVRMAVRLAGDSISFAGASASVYDELPHYGESGGRWHTLYDAIDTSKYTFVREAAGDAPLVFLGRLERIKGAHGAIARFATLADFYGEDPRRAASREIDVGLWWRERADEPLHRAAWVQATGELYAVRLGPAGDTEPAVELLARFDSGAAVGVKLFVQPESRLRWLVEPDDPRLRFGGSGRLRRDSHG